MARAFGRIHSSIWDDPDFLELDPLSQRMYLFLISQKNLNHAGLLPLTVRRWAAAARTLTVEQVCQALANLAAARFVVLDEQTEELLVRSFIRRDDVYKQPRVMGSAVSGAMEISSKALRWALLIEVDRLPLDELSDEPTRLRNGTESPSIRAQVEAHINTLRKAFWLPRPPSSGGGSTPPSGGGSPTPSGTPSAGGSGGPAEPLPQGDTEGDWGTRARAGVPLPLPLPLSPTPQLSSSPAAPDDEETNPGTSAKPPKDTTGQRADVDALCNRLAELMIANGCKPPTIIQAWRDAARLLLDRDGREYDKAMALLEWCQANEFWRTNILSMPAFRRQYEQLRLKALAEWERAQGATVLPFRRQPDDTGTAAHMERYLARVEARKAAGGENP